ncbi:hypothetical protein GFS60_06523 (plasmid) [Rhodococcus sp. WAY2]|nr:hypothetical protein GFS60_06523 [Rhodococcus sp. WAY2]
MRRERFALAHTPPTDRVEDVVARNLGQLTSLEILERAATIEDLRTRRPPRRRTVQALRPSRTAGSRTSPGHGFAPRPV